MSQSHSGNSGCPKRSKALTPAPGTPILEKGLRLLCKVSLFSDFQKLYLISVDFICKFGSSDWQSFGSADTPTNRIWWDNFQKALVYMKPRSCLWNCCFQRWGSVGSHSEWNSYLFCSFECGLKPLFLSWKSLCAPSGTVEALKATFERRFADFLWGISLNRTANSLLWWLEPLC